MMQAISKKSCAFTGHRPKAFPWGYDETDTRCIALKRTIAEEITKLIGKGYTDFFSGMAQGVDSYCAQIILEMRRKNPVLNLHCILPCEGQADRWSSTAQEQYHFILKEADSVEYISRRYYDGCMLDRNRRLVESAGMLLAVYNGEQRGGTAATVRYARKLKRKITIITPDSLEIVHEPGA